MESAAFGACAAMTGNAGATFARALGAVLAAHCAHTDSLQWPPDGAEQIFQQGGGTFDFVIVGAGTAGSLVANRLGQVDRWRILLIEAGGDPTADSDVPAFLFSNQETEQDWQYRTVKNEKHCRMSKDGSCKWAQGKGMGGSSSINAMLYTRGNKADYDEWGTAGNNGWSYEDVLKYFKKTENFSQMAIVEDADIYHSNLGEFYVEPYGGPQNPWKNVIVEAWKELGYKYNEDINGKSQIGISNVLGTVKNGMRYNSAKRLLNDAHMKGNLHIMKNSLVTKLIIDSKSKITTGLLVKRANGEEVKIIATKEIILCAGAIKSPQILMLSGIGPKEHLREIMVTPISDLPVGKNLQDHFLFPVFFQSPENMSINISKERVIEFLLQYMMTREGPFRGIGMTDLLGFVDTKYNSEIPDIEYHHIYISKEDEIILPSYRVVTGFVDEFWENIETLNKHNDLIGFYPTLLKPKSRGEILLSSSNPDSKPIIKAGYMIDDEDVDTMMRGIEFVLKLLNTTVFKSLGIKVPHFNFKRCSKTQPESSYWKCYMNEVGSTIFHPVGANKMAPIENAGVVDATLKVYGVRGLRIVDASIMPAIPRGNTMAPTLMVAEKGADMIKTEWLGREKSEL